MSLGQLTFQAQARLQLAEATRERGELALALGEARAERTMAWAQAYRDSCEQSPTGRRHDADVTVAHLDARIAHLESAVDVTRSQVGYWQRAVDWDSVPLDPTVRVPPHVYQHYASV